MQLQTLAMNPVLLVSKWPTNVVDLVADLVMIHTLEFDVVGTVLHFVDSLLVLEIINKYLLFGREKSHIILISLSSQDLIFCNLRTA